jgi:hypothetical protein
MKVGDLVRTMDKTQGSKLRCGIIVGQCPSFHYDVINRQWDVMLEDGTVNTYISAALRKVKVIS